MPKLQHTTKTAIDKIPYPPSGQQLYWYADLKGFGVLVGTRQKPFVVEASINGNSRRSTVGRYGDIALAQARAKAIAMLGDMRGRKIDLGLTLQEAWTRYEGSPKPKDGRPIQFANMRMP